MQYKRAPIVEAVIEIRFSDVVPMEKQEKLIAHLTKLYPQPEIHQMITFRIGETGQQEPMGQGVAGYRFRNLDQTEAVSVGNSNFAFARLAPYENWDGFIGAVKREWAIWSKFNERRTISRIGLRYINRIDIPVENEPRIHPENYIKLYPEIDDTLFGDMQHYALQIGYAEPDDGFSLTLNSGPIPSPLLDHASFLLDIDIGKERNLPQRDDAMWGLIDNMRDIKNEKFENLITDAARELFNS